MIHINSINHNIQLTPEREVKPILRHWDYAQWCCLSIKMCRKPTPHQSIPFSSLPTTPTAHKQAVVSFLLKGAVSCCSLNITFLMVTSPMLCIVVTVMLLVMLVRWGGHWRSVCQRTTELLRRWMALWHTWEEWPPHWLDECICEQSFTCIQDCPPFPSTGIGAPCLMCKTTLYNSYYNIASWSWWEATTITLDCMWLII